MKREQYDAIALAGRSRKPADGEKHLLTWDMPGRGLGLEVAFGEDAIGMVG